MADTHMAEPEHVPIPRVCGHPQCKLLNIADIAADIAMAAERGDEGTAVQPQSGELRSELEAGGWLRQKQQMKIWEDLEAQRRAGNAAVACRVACRVGWGTVGPPVLGGWGSKTEEDPGFVRAKKRKTTPGAQELQRREKFNKLVDDDRAGRPPSLSQKGVADKHGYDRPVVLVSPPRLAPRLDVKALAYGVSLPLRVHEWLDNKQTVFIVAQIQNRV
ncbi:uncharacterized protein EV422DRAFT_579375 [Fimicolochytrium jonesii]|uniref:uncharacterized protein n=1 Tax=Fimicolochytrium jonesii TaxID=1396493 RepID=UPI0022FED28E|nr:uncharacterized protein EV422DRAFT_579375 [Fimicolochytrium jonesii]KAI8819297.1 hypothetical protein EV422DRAFT_579375 [Fimicolochytrium jonesii]